jgi:hypothetical protein
MIIPMAAPLYREVQYYRELPPFTLLTVAGALFGWFLIIWVGVLRQPLGALDMPPWLAGAIGLPFAVLLPIAYFRLNMLTEVYPDQVRVNNGMSGGNTFRLADVRAVDARDGDIHDDYNVRNVGRVRQTRIAYTVATTAGVQLTLADDRQFLIGSKQPRALAEAITAAWRAGHAPDGIEW